MISTSLEAYDSVRDSGKMDTQIAIVVDLVERMPGLVFTEYADHLRNTRHPEVLLYDKHAVMRRLCEAKKRNLLTHGYRVRIPGDVRHKMTWFPIWQVARIDMPLDCDYGHPTIRINDVIYSSVMDAELFTGLENNLGSLEETCKRHAVKAAHVTIQTANGFATYVRHNGGVWILKREGE